MNLLIILSKMYYTLTTHLCDADYTFYVQTTLFCDADYTFLAWGVGVSAHDK